MPLLLMKVFKRFFVRYDRNLFFHPMPEGFPYGKLSVSIFNTSERDRAVAERILGAFRRASSDEEKYAPQKAYPDAWDDNRKTYHSELLKILLDEDSQSLADYLSNMHRWKSTYGVSGNVAEYRSLRKSSYLRRREAALIKDILVSLAEALDILPYETVIPYVAKKNIYADPDWLVEKIEKKLSIKIAPPEVDGGLFKLELRSGLFEFRDLQSLYAAWRISSIVGSETPVGEIGGGLGKVAVYAHRFGFRDYSLFDLPVMNVMTAWHLIKALPDAKLVLYGEPDEGKAIRILPYWEFGNKKHGLVFNQDSFPEMGKEVVEDYLNKVKRCSKYLLSINHEHQARLFSGTEHRSLVIPKIIREMGGFGRTYRFPSWLRKGYVEEQYETK